MTISSSPPRLAYLTGQYPAPSHTFIQREIAMLEQLGLSVQPFAIRPSHAATIVGEEEKAEAKRTYYVLQAAKNPLRLAGIHARLAIRNPKRWFGALALALRTGRPGLKGLLWQMFYFAEAGILAHEFAHREITHLHNHFADSSANVAMIASRLAAIPFSFTLHGPAELFEPTSWHLGEKIARAEFVVCISDFARSQAMLFSDPEHWRKLRIVHCGVVIERFAETSAPKLQEAPFTLLFVGRLTQIKGVRLLFQALEDARRTHPDIRLVLVGDGEERAWVDAEANRLGKVDVLGFRSQTDVIRHLGEADCLVLPSFAEGLPVVLMEALAAGRPVIATRIAGVSELVEDGVTGRLVPPGNLEHLTAAIRDMANDAGARHRMGQEGHKIVCREFDARREAARLLTLFQGDPDGPVRPEPVRPV